MNDQQRREALYEAVRELVSDGEPEADPVPPPRRSSRALLALAFGWMFLGYIWIARPSWIFGERIDPVLTAERRDAALRFTLYLEQGRIEEFADENGRLPNDLAEVGPVEEGVSWRHDGDGYDLTGELQGQTLRLSRQMDPDSFLGGALGVLRR